MGVDSEEVTTTTPNGEHNNDEDHSVGFPFTKEFLEFAFDKKVERFSVTLGSNPGDNFMSIMHAVEVVFKGAWQVPQHYLVKVYPNHPSRREMLDQLDFFGKELFMYQQFLPSLIQEIKETGADPGSVAVSTAPFHGGNVAASPSPKWKDSPWAKENFIIMSDIRKSGFMMADRMNGMDLEHAKLALQELAKWHALAWAHKERNEWTSLTQKYPNLIDQVFSAPDPKGEYSALMNSMGDGALKVTEDNLGVEHPAHLALKRALAGSPTCFHDTMKMCVLPQGRNEEDYEEAMLRVKPEVDEDYIKDPWLTATHGDCWVNNMLFRYDTNGEPDRPRPVEVTFVDLQIYREACPTIDLAYFLFTSVRAPIRIPHKDKLLQVYHDSFSYCCKELKVKPYPGFAMSSLKRRFRRSERFGLLSAIMGLIFMLKPPEEAVDMDGEGEGLDMISKLVKENDQNTKFQDELIPTVLDLYENGVI